jgi:5-methylthioadenosine/S-adenosylhomocysteine deaminase
MDDMAIADDDDMFSEIRLAHVLQRIAESEAPMLRPRELLGFAWDGGARVIGAPALVGRLEPGRRADVVLVDLAALSAPWAIEGGDVWDLLLTRAKAEHVRTVLVDGRVLLRDRVLTQLDRAALAGEVAAAAAAAVAARDAEQWRLVERIGEQIVRHYAG